MKKNRDNEKRIIEWHKRLKIYSEEKNKLLKSGAGEREISALIDRFMV